MNAIITLTVLGLVLTELYCISWLIDYAKDRSDERSEARREKYRRQAYKEMNDRWTAKQNRQNLWRSIRK